MKRHWRVLELASRLLVVRDARFYARKLYDCRSDKCGVLLKMAVMEGFLSKWTNVMKGWQYRWFVLDENAGILSYYTVSKMIYLIKTSFR